MVDGVEHDKVPISVHGTVIVRASFTNLFHLLVPNQVADERLTIRVRVFAALVLFHEPQVVDALTGHLDS